MIANRKKSHPKSKDAKAELAKRIRSIIATFPEVKAGVSNGKKAQRNKNTS